MTIRWAERLVVMPYPDEDGHHLEVINSQSGFGALEIRRSDGAAPDAAVFKPGDRTRSPSTPLTLKAPGCVLFVLHAGIYDVQTRGGASPVWHPGFEVPLDRTRFWMAP